MIATHLQTVALGIYIVVIVAMVAAVLIVTTVDRRKRGDAVYRGRVDRIIDEALPREDASDKWKAYRAEVRQ